MILLAEVCVCCRCCAAMQEHGQCRNNCQAYPAAAQQLWLHLACGISIAACGHMQATVSSEAASRKWTQQPACASMQTTLDCMTVVILAAYTRDLL